MLFKTHGLNLVCKLQTSDLYLRVHVLTQLGTQDMPSKLGNLMHFIMLDLLFFEHLSVLESEKELAA